jgi:hypothetical protein
VNSKIAVSIFISIIVLTAGIVLLSVEALTEVSTVSVIVQAGDLEAVGDSGGLIRNSEFIEPLSTDVRIRMG